MIDPEKEIMYTALYNIACGEVVTNRSDMVKLAARAIEQVNKFKSLKIMEAAARKAKERELPEIDIEEVLQK